MSHSARAQQEPSMEEILAAIRRIIADEGGPEGKPADANANAQPAPTPTPAPAPAAANSKSSLSRDEIEAIAARVEAAKPYPADVLTLSDVVEPSEHNSPRPAELSTPKLPRDPAPETKNFRAIDPVENLFRDEIEKNPPTSSNVERSLATPLRKDEGEKPPAPSVAASPAPAPRPVRTPPPGLNRDEPQKSTPMAAKITPPLSIIDDPALMSPAATAAVSAAFNSLASTILSKDARTLEDLVREMIKPMLRAWLDDNLPSLVERLVRSEIERVSRSGR
jgi:cell pole-organizing protein PopZ